MLRRNIAQRLKTLPNKSSVVAKKIVQNFDEKLSKSIQQ